MSIRKIAGAAESAFDPRNAKLSLPPTPQPPRPEVPNLKEIQTSMHEEFTKRDEQRFMERLADMLNQSAKWSQKRLRFQVHDETERLMVQVLDAETEEVIRELPPEEALDLAARIQEMIGILLDEMA